MIQGGEAFVRATAAVGRALPDQVFAWHRSDGVATIRIRTRTQLMAIGGAALIIGWLGLASFGVSDPSTAIVKSAELARMQVQLAAMRSTTKALRGEVAGRAAAIEKRQRLLAALLAPRRGPVELAALLPQGGDDSPVSIADEAANDKLLAPFRKLEAEQFAFVDKASGAAKARLRDTESLVRRLGLDPDRLLAASPVKAEGARGGPYIPVSVPTDAEPRFRDLFVSWKKLEALEAALAVVPSYLPVRAVSYSSGFGVRFDPFTGVSAMHAGVDLMGKQGEPIYAAANGTVSLAGWSGAYGNCVEVGHGRGLATRYGHLSAILVHPGDVVRQGDVIARMGSTGRSSGTHLHFEVRIDGRAVNPRPYLDASGYVLAAQHRGEAAGPGYAGSDSAL